MVQGYDQSFGQDVAFTGTVATKLSGDFPLESRGVRQIITAGPNAEVRFRYPDGQPAIIRVAMGTGAVNYIASSLEPLGYARLLDVLFTQDQGQPAGAGAGRFEMADRGSSSHNPEGGACCTYRTSIRNRRP